jgi:hypothetical protein
VNVRDYNYFAADFTAGGEWKVVSVPFASLGRPSSAEKVEWTARDLRALMFEISRPPGRFGWLELDNVRFW